MHLLWPIQELLECQNCYEPHIIRIVRNDLFLINLTTQIPH